MSDLFNRKIIITGGAGFIGSHVVKRFVTRYPDYQIINLDALTYAGNLENLKEVEDAKNYQFVKGNIIHKKWLFKLFEQTQPTSIIHLAAESHVDRSISHPEAFVETNIVGTVNLLNAAVEIWKNDFSSKMFYHISTDEVYGSLGSTGYFTENSPYDPRSPYAASKASSDHLVRAYHATYGLPIIISNCSNNYGPNQFPEKLIPLLIHNIQKNKLLPIYGEGLNIRDWLYVEDHAAAIDLIYHKSQSGVTYNIGGDNEWKNIDLVHMLCKIMDRKLDRKAGSSASLITFVEDRKGHDMRYAIDASKIKGELNWKPSVNFEEGLEKTVDWYLSNASWLKHVTTGAYQEYYNTQYSKR